MIQFNLLPDVKLEYIKARRTKQMVTLVSFIVTGVSVGLVVLLFVGVNVVQRNHLNNLNDDIRVKTEQLKSENDIDKILTVQNQLNSLNGLHDAKPAAERLGPYLAQLTPNEVSISDLSVDFSNQTMKIDGSTDALKWVNTFIDTLKFTTFELDGQQKNAFSGVVMSSFNRADSGQSAGKAAAYQITLTFDPAIFDTTKGIKLTVPNQITTRSVTEKPAPLFEQQSSETGEEQ